MLSICIPIYAYDVRALVQQLYAQAQVLDIPWEILLLDDASPASWHERNKDLDKLVNVRYDRLSTNLGRAAIRNELARRATYAYLLFLDADGIAESSDFLARYRYSLQPDRILCGGRTYAPNPPDDANLQLHWYYGKNREVRKAKERQQQPYLGFMTNNFVVPRKILQRIPFDEGITTYGHEDTLFGQALAEADIRILHLDNPVRHLGLEPGDVWLAKQKTAIANLSMILRSFPQLDTRLLRWWRTLRRWPVIESMYLWFLRPLLPSLKHQLLHSQRPPLWSLDLLKLYWLSEESGQEHE
jgi:glycosyltransferase involved in cell wall biosynthesis